MAYAIRMTRKHASMSPTVA